MSPSTNLGTRVPAWMRPIGPFVPALAILALQLLWFPVEIGAWTLGVVIGLLTAQASGT
jgi:hypothetical protein